MTSRTSIRRFFPGRALLHGHVARFRFSHSPLRFLMPAIALLLLAAAPRPASAGVLNYLRDRGEDFLDIFRIRYTVPYRAEGYGAKARVTALAQVGYVHLNGDVYGMDRRALGHIVERRTEGGVSVFYASRTEMTKIGGNQYLDSDTAWSQAAARGIVRQRGAWDDGRRHPASIGAEVELGLFGLDLGVYPTEAFDFVTGWIFFDIYKDDRSFTDRLPEFDTEAKEAKAKEEAAKLAADEGAMRAKTRAADGPTTPGAATPGKSLLPEGPEEPGAESTPGNVMNESSDSTLGSEFVTPRDVESLKSDAAAPGTETVETPLATEPGQAPAPTPEPENPGSETAPGAPTE